MSPLQNIRKEVGAAEIVIYEIENFSAFKSWKTDNLIDAYITQRKLAVRKK